MTRLGVSGISCRGGTAGESDHTDTWKLTQETFSLPGVLGDFHAVVEIVLASGYKLGLRVGVLHYALFA